MKQDNITISKQDLLKAYREAEPSQKELMKQLFGAATFTNNFNVMERVKTFQDALNELGDDHPLVRQFVCVCNIAFNNSGVKLDADIIAYLKLRIIAAALNEGWRPKFTKDEYRYYPYFYLIDEDKKRCAGRPCAFGGLVCACPGTSSARSGASRGVRLAFKTRELAEYAGKQFIDIWTDYICKIGGTEKTEAE